MCENRDVKIKLKYTIRKLRFRVIRTRLKTGI